MRFLTAQKLEEYKSVVEEAASPSARHLILNLISEIERLSDALDKIRDPRKRHKESDSYTELGCVMQIADDALHNR